MSPLGAILVSHFNILFLLGKISNTVARRSGEWSETMAEVGNSFMRGSPCGTGNRNGECNVLSLTLKLLENRAKKTGVVLKCVKSVADKEHEASDRQFRLLIGRFMAPMRLFNKIMLIKITFVEE